jgi:hypothetical protein
MSESIAEAVAAEAAIPDVTTDVTLPAVDVTTQGANVTTDVTDVTPPETPEQPKPEAEKVSKRVASLTRKIGEEARRADAAERDLAAARALLQAGRGEEEQPAPRATQDQPSPEDLRAQIRFEDRLKDIDAAGKKELGAEWDAAKEALGSWGATNMQTPKGRAFLEGLAEVRNPTKVFAHLAEDPDALTEIMRKSASGIGARLSQIDAELSKPVTRPLSSAPKPPAKVEPSGVLQNYDLHNYPIDMPMSEYVKLMDAALPPHLGGRRKSA